MRALFGLLAFTMLLGSIAAHAQSADELIGIWRGRVDYGPTLRGTLTIHKYGRAYGATIGIRHARSSVRGAELRFAFGHDGTFRGHSEGSSIAGFWIQPGRDAPVGGDPGGSSQAYATPVRLVRTGPFTWRGEVVPLPDQFTLWLSIFKARDGALMAAFRNPELNSTGGAARFEVTRSGDRIRFSAKRDATEIMQEGQLLRGPDRIRITWKDVGSSLELKRVSGREAAAFYPRAPGSQPYTYAKPRQLADGWRTARASQTGLDEQALQSIVRGIAAADPSARPPQLMHSILVAHRGRLVLEEYFYGFDRLTPHDTRSAAKTFASVLLGTAPARLAHLAPATRIYDVMRGLGPFTNPDPRKSKITLGHLMTHTSGLACDDNNDASPGNEATMQGQKSEPNWWRYTLNLPVVHEPGSRYAYCSANMNLVGGALTVGTGIWLPELFRRTITEPLQFGEWHWNLMSNGEGYAGGGAFLLPRDLLKIGQTYLDGGMWNRRRIVPAQWVAESTDAHVEVTPQTTGLSEDDSGNFYIRGADGLAWHLGSLKAADRSYRTYSAVGNGGQLLIAVPQVDLVVLLTGGNYGQGGVWLRWPQQIVGDKIIAAMHLPK